jgi:hypothetical protein
MMDAFRNPLIIVLLLPLRERRDEIPWGRAYPRGAVRAMQPRGRRMRIAHPCRDKRYARAVGNRLHADFPADDSRVGRLSEYSLLYRDHCLT